jgi:AraC-like DNA-binding protein
MTAGYAPVTLGSSRSAGVDVDGFLITRVSFPPLLRLPLHTHERATVAVILSGSFDGLMRHASRPCPAATVLTEPPGEPHGNLFERAGAEVLTIQPDPARLDLLEPFAGVHPVHLTRVFRLHYGTPVGAYVRGLRLDWAAGRLTASGQCIAEIALQAGFYDQSHFTRAFKRRFGLTPRAYRRAAQQ